MTNDFDNSKEKKLFKQSTNGIKTKGTKMPINHLKGIRNKVLDNYRKEKDRSLTENIQYESISKFHDKKFLEKKIKKTTKNNFQKNRYRFKDLKSKSFGKL
jgi:hypothetical protein